MTPWQIWVDTGGTFTDGFALAPDGSIRRVKILSSSALRGTVREHLGGPRLRVEEGWEAPPGLIAGLSFRRLGGSAEVAVARYDPSVRELTLDATPPEPVRVGDAFELISDEEAPILAARLLTSCDADQPLPPLTMRLATTLGTNALLQRAGVPVALFVTRGFADLLRIGNQQRPDLFALDVRRPEALYERVVEVGERIDATGAELAPLDLGNLEAGAKAALDAGVRVAAVALVNSYRDPAHERQLARQLRAWGFEHVSISTDLAPRIKIVPRAQTAVVDAYLAPVVRSYLERIGDRLGDDNQLLVMTSAGGLLAPEGYRPKDSLLSGPAGGVVGAARAGIEADCKRLISFDMGGTSTDVSRWSGDYEYMFEHRVGDAELVAPALAIETVAAGGGSICWLDGERLRVGPDSAGASPGPACYGAGGPLTVTDVNVLLGRLQPDRFEIPIRLEPARRRLDELLDDLEQATGERPDPLAILDGLLAIADETMADAIRRISLRRGYDPSEHALIAFGGAGGQHACGVASRLGIERIVVPPDAALLSALGLGHAVIERFVERQVLEPLDKALPSVAGWLDELAEQAVAGVLEVGVPADRIEVRRRILHLRFSGQDATLDVEFRPDGDPVADFESRYFELYGHRPERREIELESVRVVASSVEAGSGSASSDLESFDPRPITSVEANLGGQPGRVPLFERERLSAGACLEGPALVVERHSSTVVAEGWRAMIDQSGALELVRHQPAHLEDRTSEPEAIRLELFTQRFSTLVTEMGQRLERTAVSTNVKERLDFSCALLDERGELVVNAPHIPVHLGALGLCVRRLIETIPMEDGDVVVTNHPGFGGSHLPDVTVVTPVWIAGRERPLGYTASRAHHAEIGGSRPGSMPPAATRLVDEGVVLAPSYLIRHGKGCWEELRRQLTEGPHPSRSVEDNLADLRAAAAANHAGAAALRALAAEHGADTLVHYMAELKGLAAKRIAAALGGLADGRYTAEETLDDGTPLRVAIEVAGERASLDFSGSGAVHPGNLNATPAIVQSAVIYLLRLLLREPLPLNEGLLRAVTIHLPEGLLNPAFPPDPALAPAVVGGNVETSQRLVDTLIKALGLAACSQGTMNNVIFGNAEYGYYETIAGGVGAGDGFHGASGVHSHMTNTRITDVEVIEHRYPVRLERFGIRAGSGGAGRFRGGDGLTREITFLAPASLSVLTQHRTVAPFGAAGGAAGAVGAQRVVRTDGTVEELSSIDGCEVEPGDRLVIETPGGGGYGEA